MQHLAMHPWVLVKLKIDFGTFGFIYRKTWVFAFYKATLFRGPSVISDGNELGQVLVQIVYAEQKRY